MPAAVSRKRAEQEAFDFRDPPPLSDRRENRTDHRQLQMNDNTWEEEKEDKSEAKVNATVHWL